MPCDHPCSSATFQVAYYGLLQLFLTPRAVYILVWNMEEKANDKGDLGRLDITKWLKSLSFHVPDANVILVGNKYDTVQDGHGMSERVERWSREWLDGWAKHPGRGQALHKLCLEQDVSLVSCKPLKKHWFLRHTAQNTAETQWGCDRNTPGLLHLIVHNGDERRSMEYFLPDMWWHSLEFLNELSFKSR